MNLFRMQKSWLLIALFGLLGCSKEEGTEATPQENYQPGKANSSWTYDTRNNITSATGSFVLTHTGRDTSINSRTYSVYSISGAGNTYFARSGSDYFQYTSFVGTDQKLELLYLKGNVAAGLSWDQDITISIPGLGSITAKVTNKVEEKGISYAVGGKTYTDVVRIKSTIGAVTLPGVPIPITPVTDINTWFANGVGRIYNRSKVNITIPTVPAINIDEETSLRSYTIVP